MNEGKTILVAEDHAVTRRNVEKVLQNEGYKVILARDGEEAITSFLAQLPDLILTNLQMPKLGGFDVATRIKQLAPEIPLLLMTALVTPQIKQQGKEIGIQAIIVKPFDFEELLKRIALALNPQSE